MLEPVIDGIYKFEFADGRDTARGSAKDIKQNFQITRANKHANRLIDKIEAIISAAAPVQQYTFAKQIVGTRIASYKDGGHYGWHVDMATMNGLRTDLSFTLFLTEPDSYEGGELQMDVDGKVRTFKGKAGQIVVYPTGVLHQVTPVTSGERLVVVGWINSSIRHEEDRKAVYKLGREVARLKELVKDPTEVDQLNYLYMNFRRRFSE